MVDGSIDTPQVVSGLLAEIVGEVPVAVVGAVLFATPIDETRSYTNQLSGAHTGVRFGWTPTGIGAYYGEPRQTEPRELSVRPGTDCEPRSNHKNVRCVKGRRGCSGSGPHCRSTPRSQVRKRWRAFTVHKALSTDVAVTDTPF